MTFANVPIFVDRSSALPLTQQVYECLRNAIREQRVTPARKLPSTRTLARELGISRNTAINAYKQLLRDGYLETFTGFGTVIKSDVIRTQQNRGMELEGRME